MSAWGDWLASLPASTLGEIDALLAGVPAMVPRGRVAQLWTLPPERHEVMLSGPAETGKTFGCCQWLHEQLLATPKAQAVMVRQAYNDLPGTAVQTYTEKVLRWPHYPHGASPDGVTVFGGNRPEWFDYPNGARLWLAGMDNPGDALSSERDFIYVVQAEEVSRKAWETLLTRATGRAGHTTHPRVLGDCNPGPPNHWILQRAAAGALHLIETRHEDNPALFDAAGALTEQGARTLAVLDGLTGIEKERLRYGRWVSAEGTVYQLLPQHIGHNLHQPDKPTQLSVDPSNGAGPYAALVIQQVGARVLVVGEFYQHGGMDEDLRDWLLASPYRARLMSGTSDPAKADTMKRLQSMLRVPFGGPEGKDITAQIGAVKSGMVVDPVTQQSALVIDEEACPHLIEEMGRRVWERPPAANPDKNVPQKPVDAWDHCCNALEYWYRRKALTGSRASGGTPPARRQPTPF
jgi:hypothetical protein